MKTYYIIISQTFPSYHPKKGKPTRFIEQIKLGGKIHTIRANYDFWEKRINAVNRGDALLSVRSWTGKPYKSKQKEHFLLGKGEVGIEGLMFKKESLRMPVAVCGDTDFCKAQPILLEGLAANDGLLTPDFEDWFKDYDPNSKKAIIHFTKFRYV
jgi:hypothetical protein